MSEMLGNQYFMGRKYPEAKIEFEKEFEKQPENLAIQKKLIICYTQAGEFSKAFNLFHSLLLKDIYYLADTDPVRDDCPCPELVNQMEKSIFKYSSAIEKNIVSGILWSYCNIAEAKKYFERAHQLETYNPTLDSVINKMESYLNRKKILTQHN